MGFSAETKVLCANKSIIYLMRNFDSLAQMRVGKVNKGGSGLGELVLSENVKRLMKTRWEQVSSFYSS